jgi:hypothetical protein
VPDCGTGCSDDQGRETEHESHGSESQFKRLPLTQNEILTASLRGRLRSCRISSHTVCTFSSFSLFESTIVTLCDKLALISLFLLLSLCFDDSFDFTCSKLQSGTFSCFIVPASSQTNIHLLSPPALKGTRFYVILSPPPHVLPVRREASCSSLLWPAAMANVCLSVPAYVSLCHKDCE